MGHVFAAQLLGALTWDPQIRGALIVLTAIVVLPGSVYLLLATNTGSRLGFLLAAAGLSGWILVMGVVWMVFGIGLKGREPTWKPVELINGSLINRTTVPAMADFPEGKWTKLQPGNPTLADAQAAGDRTLAPSSVKPAPGHEIKPPTPEELARFQSPYKQPTDYVVIDGYTKGGDNQLFTIGHHKFYVRHSPHYAVIQVQAVKKVTPIPGAAPATPQPDPNAPVITLVMVRDLGNVRLPPFLVTVAALAVFIVTCSVLHERDKEIMRLRGQLAAA
ncbi:MAG TPA: hypothetical protein VFA94_03350 [Acidimicrobiales bacterium]|nr:hypothetical protein [Acidimicrobiales bacterium]